MDLQVKIEGILYQILIFILQYFLNRIHNYLLYSKYAFTNAFENTAHNKRYMSKCANWDKFHKLYKDLHLEIQADSFLIIHGISAFFDKEEFGSRVFFFQRMKPFDNAIVVVERQVIPVAANEPEDFVA